MEDNSSSVAEGNPVKPETNEATKSSSNSKERALDTVDREKEFGTQVVNSEGTTAENNQGSKEDTKEDSLEVTEDSKNGPGESNSGNIPSEVSMSSKGEAESSEMEHNDLFDCTKKQETACTEGEETVKSVGAQATESLVKDDLTNTTYYVKWITWKGVKTAIVTQNDNGPCPLLAIINILLLRRAIKFPSMQEMVTTCQLMEYLGDHVLKEIPENMAEGDKRNFEQNMQDALGILPKLKTGLDVNVKFTGVGDFEFTPECVVFDLLNIHLYHGWLVDPQSTEYKTAVGGLSYNQLVEKVIACKEADAQSQLVQEGLLAESFLEETANQLTYHGLCELNAKVKKDELCVFFRNNHFSTLYKHQNELFLLLTDQGFLTEDHIVWQTLSNVDGDSVFVDNDFKTLPMEQQPPNLLSPGALSQEDQDYMLALSIQSEQQQQAQQPQQQQQQRQQEQQQQPMLQQQAHSQPSQLPTQQTPQIQETSDPNPPNNEMTEQELFDLQYAIQLQEEEDHQLRNEPHGRAQERRTTRRQSPPPPQQPVHQQHNGHNRDRRGFCVIL